MPILAIKAKIHADPKTEAVLKDAMLCAAKVFNGLLWHLRKEYFVPGLLIIQYLVIGIVV